MDFSGIVQWWEEWQLRVLALASLFIHFFLFVAAGLRKYGVPSWFRFIVWLAYLGGDAVAIYALAALFNHQKQEEWVSTHRSSYSLQVLWAPILLVHLGGQDGITAYNIEDNELWKRHVVTAVSQVTVAVYVFSKSWSGDKLIWETAIQLFYVGIVQCLVKPWDLRKVSINILVGSSGSEENDGDPTISSLDQYIRAVRQHFQRAQSLQTMMERVEANNPLVFPSPPYSEEHGGIPIHDGSEETGGDMILASNGNDDQAVLQVEPQHCSEFFDPEIWKPYDLFVDLTPPYSDRLACLKYFLDNPGKAHLLVQRGLSETFDRLYTKKSLKMPRSPADPFKLGAGPMVFARFLTLEGLIYIARLGAVGVLFSCLLLFPKSNKEAYNQIDVRITYALIYPPALVDFALPLVKIFVACEQVDGSRPWPDHVAQYNLIGYLARNKKHRILLKLLPTFFKDFLDQLWRMKPCKSKSSRAITELVFDHVRAGWHLQIHDVTSYHRFNDNRGQWTLDREGLLDMLGWSLRRPFDESLILWHLATDFCFHHTDTPPTHQASLRSRELSNYMAYLLFVNPEMLIAGARRSRFRAAYRELKGIPLDEELVLGEREVARSIMRGVTMDTEGSGVVHDAWAIAQKLIALQGEDQEKAWRVVQGVWVEMLCFSASRCRGYLHAKSMGSGGQYMSYVWLLLLYMGMETLAEKMQRVDMQEEGDDGGTAADPRSASAASAADPASSATPEPAINQKSASSPARAEILLAPSIGQSSTSPVSATEDKNVVLRID